MLRFRSAPAPAKAAEVVRDRSLAPAPIPIAPPSPPSIRRTLSREGGRALEVLGHAIEYLADEYAADPAHSGPLGNADPRIEAIQILKRLNRAVYYSGTETEPASRRMRRWFGGIADARTR